jgi:hypothetical protein
MSGTSFYQLVTRLMRPTDSQQVVPTSLILSACNKLLTSQDDGNKLIATCYEQPVLVFLEQLVATCQNNWEQAV